MTTQQQTLPAVTTVENVQPTVLLFDVAVHDSILVFKQKDDPSVFWAFNEDRRTGDYVCYECDMLGKKLPNAQVFDKFDMPLLAIQEPNTTTRIANDFLEWLWIVGINL